MEQDLYDSSDHYSQSPFEPLADDWSTNDDNSLEYLQQLPFVPPANDWTTNITGNSSHCDANIGITVEGPLEDGRPGRPTLVLETTPHNLALFDGPYGGELMPSLMTPPRHQFESRYGVQPFSSTQPLPSERSQRFNRHPSQALPVRAHSDNTADRPRFGFHSHELQGSAVEDEFYSPINSSPHSSMPPSPAYGNDGLPHSSLAHWPTEFLSPTNASIHRRPHASSFSSTTSSAPSLEWDTYQGAFSLPADEAQPLSLDGSSHPPMVPASWGADRGLLVPEYRHSRASSSGISDTSSVPPSSPNVPWGSESFDFGSLPSTPFEGDFYEDYSGVSPTISSDDTQRPASRLGDDLPDLTQRQLRLQDGPVAASGYFGGGDFGSYRQKESASYLGGRLAQHHPPNIATSSSEGYSTEGGISPSRWSGDAVEGKPDVRRQVGTDAGRRASHNRRKDKTTPGAFVCNDCGADFTAKHNLRHHENSHKSVKNFACDLCGSTFGTKHVLTRHRGKCLKNNSS